MNMKNVLMFFVSLLVFSGLLFSGSFFGKVVDDDGAALENVQVSAINGTVPPSTNYTDSSGEFIINDLVTSDYFFEFYYNVDYHTFTTSTFTLNIADNINYTILNAGPIVLDKKDEPSPGPSPSGDGKFFGKVLNKSNTTINISGADLSLYNDDGDLIASNTSDVDGNYILKFSDDDDYIISVSADNFMGDTFNFDDVIVSDNNENLELEPATLTTYSFTGVVEEYGSNIPLQYVNVDLSYPNGTVMSDTTNANGEYSFQVVAGNYGLIKFTLTGYLSKETNVGYIGLNEVFQDIQLHSLSIESILTGTVTDIDTGSVLEEVAITNSSGDVLDTTDASGQYSFTIDEGTYDITYALIGYESQTIGILIGSGTNVENVVLDSTPFGQVHGYVTDENGDGLDGAEVSSSGFTNLTNDSGYYLLNLPNGSRDIAVSLNDYDNEMEKVNIEEGITKEQNFTLSVSHDDDNDRSSSSSRRTSSTSTTTTPSIPYTSTTTTELDQDGLQVERKIVTVRDEETKVILTITNYGDDVGPFELREHPPSYIDENDISDYSLDPYETVSSPLTLVWRFDGLKENDKIVFAYTLDKVYSTMKESHFDASIYDISASVPQPQLKEDKVIVTAPTKGFVGDTITVIITEEDGELLPNQNVLIVSPYHNTFTKTTNDEGKISVTLEIEGVYSYLVPNKVLTEDATTEAVSRSQVQIVELNETNITTTAPKNTDFISNFMATLGEPGILLPAIGLIFIGIVLFLFVGAYIGYLAFAPEKEEPEEEDKDMGEESIVLETGDLEN